jgi:nicotinate phosphoribosyltransferase
MPHVEPSAETHSDRAALAPARTPPAGRAARQAYLRETLARFPASLFHFDPRLASGWYADRYFPRTVGAVALDGRDPIVTMQVFAKERGVLAGAYEVLRLLETQLAANPETGRRYTLADFTIDTLMDGDPVEPWMPVMHITGPYVAYGHLQTEYLGILADRTLVASNTRRVIHAAVGLPVIAMAARHGDWRRQTADGYAARVGGADSVSSDAGGDWWGEIGVGTMPHDMIALYGGDVVAATLAYVRYRQARDPAASVVPVVDYHNDCVGDAVRVADAVRAEHGEGVLTGVRLDTSEKLIDRTLIGDPAVWGRATLTGVNETLVRRVRAALDAAGHPHVGIWVSGGFHARKIHDFVERGVPVAGFGVGSSLLGHNRGEADGMLSSFDFTADIVEVDGRAESKVGRGVQENPMLVRMMTDGG